MTAIKKVIITLSALGVLLFGTAIIAGLAMQLRPRSTVAPQTTISVAAPPVTQPPTISELLKLVNEERAKNGVAPLVEDSRLDQSAQRKTDDEVKYNYFGHISPNDGKHGYEYINDVGISCKTDGENLSQDTSFARTSDMVIRGWINSKPHHDAMINPNYSLIGFGISGTDTLQVSAHFCQQ